MAINPKNIQPNLTITLCGVYVGVCNVVWIFILLVYFKFSLFYKWCDLCH
jgi:hypothetical protein